MGFFGPGELAIIGIVAVLLFGSQLPKMARSLGQALPQFKKGMREVELEIEQLGDKVKEEVNG